LTGQRRSELQRYRFPGKTTLNPERDDADFREEKPHTAFPQEEKLRFRGDLPEMWMPEVCEVSG